MCWCRPQLPQREAERWLRSQEQGRTGMG